MFVDDFSGAEEIDGCRDTRPEADRKPDPDDKGKDRDNEREL